MTVEQKILKCKVEVNKHLAEASRAVAGEDYAIAEVEITDALRQIHSLLSLHTIDNLTGQLGFDRVKSRQ